MPAQTVARLREEHAASHVHRGVQNVQTCMVSASVPEVTSELLNAQAISQRLMVELDHAQETDAELKSELSFVRRRNADLSSHVKQIIATRAQMEEELAERQSATSDWEAYAEAAVARQQSMSVEAQLAANACKLALSSRSV